MFVITGKLSDSCDHCRRERSAQRDEMVYAFFAPLLIGIYPSRVIGTTNPLLNFIRPDCLLHADVGEKSIFERAVRGTRKTIKFDVLFSPLLSNKFSVSLSAME